MKKTILAFLASPLLSGLALAGEQPSCEQLAVLAGKTGVLRSPNGSTELTAATSGSQTVIRDSRGQP